ncbi:uncharacterized protein OCT59_000170 [Rhizophagus irregularis]|uniref:uncharacterized protein n=1 Tax=Rhizophagus irregularis TaxID=588596 RepID=UPI0033233661|nr:hypothetical protein OCT59_000170 [Rhizophagus irregularis]
MPNKEVALKYLCNSQDLNNEFINVVKSYSIEVDPYNYILNIHGISQNLNTKDYVIVLDNGYCENCSEVYTNIKEKWCKTSIWKDGPLQIDEHYGILKRISDKKVTLKYLHNSYNSSNIANKLLNEFGQQHFIRRTGLILNLFGLTQNSNTNNYILVFNNNYCENCNNKSYTHINYKWCKQCQLNNLKKSFVNWASGNEKIDNFIQEMQLKINDDYDIIVEWIPYNQFSDIKEISKNDSFAVYSAVWKSGPLRYDTFYNKLQRYSLVDNKVFLKYFYSLQNITNEIESYSNNTFNGNQKIYGVSQNSNTKDYLIIFQDYCCKNCGEINVVGNFGWCKPCQINNLKQNFENWTSKNKEIDELIQKMQLKIGKDDDIIIEWISYNQFINIKEISKDDFAMIYSAIWMEGPLQYDWYNGREQKRMFTNKKVALKYLCNSQDINEILNEIREHSISNDDEILNIYGISQYPSTKNYIIVLQDGYCKDCGRIYTNVNKKWCKPCKGGFAIVYSAIWKDGPLKIDYRYDGKLKRIPNKKVALKCLNNSQNINNKFLNEVKEYSISNNDNILNLYGISQNPDTKDYIMILNYANNGNINNYSYINIEWYWFERLWMLRDIIEGLKKIHGNNMIHRDFHTGNILLSLDFNSYGKSGNPSSDLYISDMGLCGEVGNVDETKIYGVMPYVAPEVLKSKPYTQAADIYSFGMIMYFVATKKQPFANCAHDNILALNICNGNRPKINENEVPKCYVDLMERCWDLNPNNRPSAIEVSELIELFCNSSYMGANKDKEIEKQFKEAEEYRKANYTSIGNSQLTSHHPQAYYTSRLLNPFTRDLSNNDTDCLDCMID